MSVIGIDLGGTKILGVRADHEGRILARVRQPTHGEHGLEQVIERIAEVIRELMQPEKVEAIAIGVPGPTDPRRGIVVDPPNLQGWENVPLRDMLYARLDLPPGVPVELANDANAAALGECRFGAGSLTVAGRDIKHLVYLTISTGVGGGVVADGRLLQGANGFAGELGHMIIDSNGPRCNCGNVGCLEALASGTALAKEAATVVYSRRHTSMTEAVGGDPSKMTAEIVERAAREGDPIACELMHKEGVLVGVGVVNCIHAFNPELVVIGGGVANAGEILFKPMRETVEERVMPAYVGTYEIVPAALGADVGAMGAVAVALQAVREL